MSLARTFLPAALLLVSTTAFPLFSQGSGGSPAVLISEVGTGSPAFIELFNRSSLPVDVGGYLLTGTESGVATFVFAIPPATIIPAGAWLVIAENGNLPGSLDLGVPTGFTPSSTFEVSLTHQGQPVDYVFRDTGGAPLGPVLTGNFTGLLDQVGTSVQRCESDTDTDDADDFLVTEEITPGAGAPLSGRLSLTQFVDASGNCQFDLAIDGCNAAGAPFCILVSLDDQLCPFGPILGLDLPADELSWQVGLCLNQIAPFGGVLDGDGDFSFPFVTPGLCPSGFDFSVSGGIMDPATHRFVAFTPVCNSAPVPPAPSAQARRAYVSFNGVSNAGLVGQFDQTFQPQASHIVGNNEGVFLDLLGNLYQAGDRESFGSVRIYSQVRHRGAISLFDASRDRLLGGGPTANLVAPKGMAFAHGRGLIFIADVGAAQISVFGSQAGGDVPPVARTQLASPAWDTLYDEPADRLFVAFTNGTVGVFDQYVARNFLTGGTAMPDRTLIPSDQMGQPISTNLHGIAYQRLTDRLIVSDVGAANAAQGAGFASDGSLYVLDQASVADGPVVPARVIRGPNTLLGNPVDIVLRGSELRVAEKANDRLLIFTDVFNHPGGDVAPAVATTANRPESLVTEPGSPFVGNDLSDLDVPGLPLLGLIGSSNPARPAPSTGVVAQHDPDLNFVAGFQTGRRIESIRLDRKGDLVATFDDPATSTGGLFFGNRVALSRWGSVATPSEDRAILGPQTGLVTPKGLDVVDARGVVLVAEFNAATPSIRAFSTVAEGNVGPRFVTPLSVRPWDLDYEPSQDRLFVSLTDGTVAVFDGYFAGNPAMAQPSRILAIDDGTGQQESQNFHGIVYDALNDVLILTDVGSPADPTDGRLYVVAGAGSASGLVMPQVRIAGPQSMLGNPVDVTYDGSSAYVAEKSNDLIMRFAMIRQSASGDIAPSDQIASVKPESVALLPFGLSPLAGGSID